MIDQQISQFITGQLPSFYENDGALYITFVQAYYEWMEQTNGVVWNARNLYNFRDIDQTPAQFVQYFKDEYLLGIPNTLEADQRLLIKHIVDLYKAKGSKRGYELLFRLLFNVDIRIYLPGEFLFKPSDNQWIVPNYIEVTDSIYLNQLVGNKIYSSPSGSTALVESYNIININNKVINVLYLSNVVGNFPYGEHIFCTAIPGLNINNSPFCVGSLSAVSIENGGILFNPGDEVNISGTGSGAIARVVGTTIQNGKVTFNLINGGFGFSTNAQIVVSGGNGTGATFKIGSIIDQEILLVNIDEIATYISTQLDSSAAGSNLHISNTSGVFQVAEVVNATANGIGLDFAYISGSALTNNEILSNTSLGIANLQIIEIDNPNFVNLTGPETALNNANLVPGIILIGGTSGDTIYINSILPKVVYNANATVTFANSTLVSVDAGNGYFLPTSILYGQTSGAHAFINQDQRDTNWTFPGGVITNLDTEIYNTLTYETITIGTIASINSEDPGDNYAYSPNVTITEPLVYSLLIPDGTGGYWGGDANVVAVANNSNGIVTALQITDSGFGFIPNEPLTISSNNPYIASGTAVVDGTGMSSGYWSSNKSFLSDAIFLQDSYYYQAYSYEIVAPLLLSQYQSFVNELVHPVGSVLFGRYSFIDTIQTNNQIISTSVATTA
jgi:hypothetical protein